MAWGVIDMASISSAAANLYNYTAPVANANILGDKKANAETAINTVNATKLAVESTIVTLGNKPSESLTYNALGLLNTANLANTNQNSSLTSDQAAQYAVQQTQTAISDALNNLGASSTSNTSGSIATLLNIPGVTSARQ